MAPLDQPHADTHTAFRGSLAERMALARRPDAAPELLVLLAADAVEGVRRTVAENPAAPSHADRLLAQDAVASIRISLARKLAAQAAELARSLTDRRIRLAWDALLLLAQDLAQEVRHAVADTLADLPDAPHDLVIALARDAALLVCEPLIRLSAVLTEGDLIALVREPPGAGSRAAVAGRLQLAPPVCEAVVESGDIAAMAALLRNPTSRIPSWALAVLVELAGEEMCLQEPLTCRPSLPPALLRRLAALVADDVLSQWAVRAGLPPAVAEQLRARAPSGEGGPGRAGRLEWTTSREKGLSHISFT
ncbi:DUF2336 domain-containing protein [Roseococcus sp. SYP-B2431]|uniref:DUF2336 domain-containing protein n=1 Tax=Roseococcus sp. SYP-B2431 TaxID=2496640 RepID=UPI001038D188|nr:DUF2336 domain-containing protein [Roseococcus sp. SYP-B2431]TCH98794.1 DUF2336 domain-containing protein [Roseococcus sp. SYP-B2431]